MKTKYLNIDLMTPNQSSKDVLFNSAVTKIDLMCAGFVDDIKFSDVDTRRLKTKHKYILLKRANTIEDSPEDNTIAYYNTHSNKWEYEKITNCFATLVRKKFCICFFNKKKWEIKKFTGETINLNSIN